jgi:hypothetical protein
MFDLENQIIIVIIAILTAFVIAHSVFITATPKPSQPYNEAPGLFTTGRPISDNTGEFYEFLRDRTGRSAGVSQR